MAIEPSLAPDAVADSSAALSQQLEDQGREITRRQEVERELRQRAEQLLEESRRKDRFLDGLAHELRNPLAPLLTGLHLLGLEQDPRTREQGRAMVERQARHLARLVDDLLEVARLNRGMVELRLTQLDLGQLVRTVAEEHRAAFGQAGLTLTLELPPAPVWVMGDASRLALVLTNLLQNAVKYGAGGGAVNVRLGTDAHPGQAVLAVRDDGVGIAPDLLPRLFDLYALADRGPERKRGGLGLGLAIVQGLVGLHGGGVEASSPGLGKGAEFTVRLPLRKESPVLAELTTLPGPAAERLRVLVIEDNQDAAGALQIWLEVAGHEVVVAHSGPEGVRAAADSRPDIILCDLELPGMDGYQVARELRRRPDTNRIPLFAVTGRDKEEDRSRSREAGFDQHLAKPVNPGVLQELLARAASAGRLQSG
jgi:two-component system CheB/CheR fusion protein